VSGLNEPVHAAAPQNEPGRVYVVEQAGRIMIVQSRRIRPQPFLDIRGLVSSGGERGLLSVAFHPRYAQNRRFYVNYTDRTGHTRVVEYRSNGQRAILSSARRLLLVEQPYANHNGGQVAFGPDGRLYVGMGDGGAGGDPENRAQNMGSQLGKLLAIDVGRSGAQPEIEALGLRNPWRFAFDRATGDLYLGDVGQGSWEEIDYTRRADLPGLENYGWDVYEGRARYEDKAPSGGELVFPIRVYPLGTHCAVAGGFVYRGSAVPAARGRYFYGDYCTGTVWSLRMTGGRASASRREPFRVSGLTSFGEDARGELYLVSHQGTLFRLAR
jgi:glucose/arabinose dehydrogenase